jgi:hypothetical protein
MIAIGSFMLKKDVKVEIMSLGQQSATLNSDMYKIYMCENTLCNLHSGKRVMWRLSKKVLAATGDSFVNFESRNRFGYGQPLK